MSAAWTCLGDAPAHPAALVEVEQTLSRGGTEVAIQRCATCGQLYRYERFEVNDWSGAGDFSDETQTFKVMQSDEVERVRADPNYLPHDGREHRIDGGWRRG